MEVSNRFDSDSSYCEHVGLDSAPNDIDKALVQETPCSQLEVERMLCRRESAHSVAIVKAQAMIFIEIHQDALVLRHLDVSGLGGWPAGDQRPRHDSSSGRRVIPESYL